MLKNILYIDKMMAQFKSNKKVGVGARRHLCYFYFTTLNIMLYYI
ncbi:MAG: hypothetical protein UR85_C0012G0009 [Candidatus Nomurabacteria bacterium GW2011_GWF2_35_66]|nr:MAG: hypothetical protein UR85_C0012G0009 [Candidatus Nomurabacteria bacterium GW2011_GWF2_35_66]